MPKLSKKVESGPKKAHMMSLPYWLWEWGRRNDPMKRMSGSYYLRELLIGLVGKLNVDGNGYTELAPGAAPAALPAPPPKPVQRRRMPWQITRTRENAANGEDKWSVSVADYKKLLDLAKTSKIQLLLVDPDGCLRYTVDWDSVVGNQVVLEMVAGPQGDYYMLHAGYAADSGIPGVIRCS